MSKTSWSLSIFASVLVLGLGLTPAHALNTRSFISANGNDANACTRTAPCRTLQKAHDSTNPSGEINMLDPAGYGTVVITKSISIVNDGVGSAGVLVPAGGTGITINAGATDIVNLHGLIIEGAGVGQTGIKFNTGKALTIQHCVVRNLTQGGIALAPTAEAIFAVSDTYVAHTGSTFPGIYLQPIGATFALATFNRVESYASGGPGIGLFGDLITGAGRARAIVVDSVAAYNNFGFYVASAGVTTELEVYRSSAHHNVINGVSAQGSGASFQVGQSIITGLWGADAPALGFSFGDNYSSAPCAGNCFVVVKR